MSRGRVRTAEEAFDLATMQNLRRVSCSSGEKIPVSSAPVESLH